MLIETNTLSKILKHSTENPSHIVEEKKIEIHFDCAAFNLGMEEFDSYFCLSCDPFKLNEMCEHCMEECHKNCTRKKKKKYSTLQLCYCAQIYNHEPFMKYIDTSEFRCLYSEELGVTSEFLQCSKCDVIFCSSCVKKNHHIHQGEEFKSLKDKKVEGLLGCDCNNPKHIKFNLKKFEDDLKLPKHKFFNLILSHPKYITAYEQCFHELFSIFEKNGDIILSVTVPENNDMTKMKKIYTELYFDKIKTFGQVLFQFLKFFEDSDDGKTKEIYYIHEAINKILPFEKIVAFLDLFLKYCDKFKLIAEFHQIILNLILIITKFYLKPDILFIDHYQTYDFLTSDISERLKFAKFFRENFKNTKLFNFADNVIRYTESLAKGQSMVYYYQKVKILFKLISLGLKHYIFSISQIKQIVNAILTSQLNEYTPMLQDLDDKTLSFNKMLTKLLFTVIFVWNDLVIESQENLVIGEENTFIFNEHEILLRLVEYLLKSLHCKHNEYKNKLHYVQLLEVTFLNKSIYRQQIENYVLYKSSIGSHIVKEIQTNDLNNPYMIIFHKLDEKIKNFLLPKEIKRRTTTESNENCNFIEMILMEGFPSSEKLREEQSFLSKYQKDVLRFFQEITGNRISGVNSQMLKESNLHLLIIKYLTRDSFKITSRDHNNYFQFVSHCLQNSEIDRCLAILSLYFFDESTFKLLCRGTAIKWISQNLLKQNFKFGYLFAKGLSIYKPKLDHHIVIDKIHTIFENFTGGRGGYLFNNYNKNMDMNKLMEMMKIFKYVRKYLSMNITKKLQTYFLENFVKSNLPEYSKDIVSENSRDKVKVVSGTMFKDKVIDQNEGGKSNAIMGEENKIFVEEVGEKLLINSNNVVTNNKDEINNVFSSMDAQKLKEFLILIQILTDDKYPHFKFSNSDKECLINKLQRIFTISNVKILLGKNLKLKHRAHILRITEMINISRYIESSEQLQNTLHLNIVMYISRKSPAFETEIDEESSGLYKSFEEVIEIFCKEYDNLPDCIANEHPRSELQTYLYHLFYSTRRISDFICSNVLSTKLIYFYYKLTRRFILYNQYFLDILNNSKSFIPNFELDYKHEIFNRNFDIFDLGKISELFYKSFEGLVSNGTSLKETFNSLHKFENEEYILTSFAQVKNPFKNFQFKSPITKQDNDKVGVEILELFMGEKISFQKSAIMLGVSNYKLLIPKFIFNVFCSGEYELFPTVLKIANRILFYETEIIQDIFLKYSNEEKNTKTFINSILNFLDNNFKIIISSTKNYFAQNIFEEAAANYLLMMKFLTLLIDQSCSKFLSWFFMPVKNNDFDKENLIRLINFHYLLYFELLNSTSNIHELPENKLVYLLLSFKNFFVELTQTILDNNDITDEEISIERKREENLMQFFSYDEQAKKIRKEHLDNFQRKITILDLHRIILDGDLLKNFVIREVPKSKIIEAQTQLLLKNVLMEQIISFFNKGNHLKIYELNFNNIIDWSLIYFQAIGIFEFLSKRIVSSTTEKDDPLNFKEDKFKEFYIELYVKNEEFSNSIELSFILNIFLYFRTTILFYNSKSFDQLLTENFRVKSDETIVDKFGYPSSKLVFKLNSFIRKILLDIEIQIDEKQNGGVIAKQKIRKSFIRPPQTFYLINETKNRFLNTVDRESRATKLSGLVSEMDSFIYEMLYNKVKNRSEWFKRLNFFHLEIANYVMIVIHQIIWITYFNKDYVPSSQDINFSEGDKIVLPLGNLILGIFQMIYLSIVITNWFYYKFSLSYQISIIKRDAEKYMPDESKPIKSVSELQTYKNTLVKTKKGTFDFLVLFSSDIIVFVINFISMLIYLLSGNALFLGIPLLLIINLVTIINVIGISIRMKWKQLLVMLIFTYVCIYIFSLISFYYFQPLFNFDDSYDKTTDQNIQENHCRTAIQCLMTLIDLGFRNGGGIGDALPKVSWNTSLYFYIGRFFYVVTFHIFVLLILGNIFFGIIVDAFSDLREKSNQSDNDKKNVCFICGTTRDELKINNLNFEDHIVDHNIWKYVYYVFNLRNKIYNDLDSVDSQIYNKINSKGADITWLPE